LLFSVLLFAQNRHEYSLYAGGGLSSFGYKAAVGEHERGVGGFGGLGYSYFFSETFGLRSGVELAFYSSRYSINRFSIRYLTADIIEDPFEFRSTISNYEEKHSATLLKIPLMAQLQFGDRYKFFFAFGGKVSFPLEGDFEGSIARLENSGFYALEGYEYSSQYFMGFGEHIANSSKGSANFNTTFFASVETGVKFRLKDGLWLYAGGYLDYGINNMLKRGTLSEFVEYNAEKPIEYFTSSILTSRYGNQGLVEKMRPMAFGLKLQFAFGSGKIAVPEPEVVPVPPPPPPPPPPPSPVVEVIEIEVEEIVEGEASEYGIYFEFGTSWLRGTAREKLEGIHWLMTEYPEIVLEISGHTCSIGDYDYNIYISKKRAQMAINYLVSRGISADRLILAGYGPDQPIADNDTEEGRAQNRRVEARIIGEIPKGLLR
jgi:outer membrane protein OmpA-like peptidoglycan-associated protein